MPAVKILKTTDNAFSDQKRISGDLMMSIIYSVTGLWCEIIY